jgi:twitching motility two-component system response regulator PilH
MVADRASTGPRTSRKEICGLMGKVMVVDDAHADLKLMQSMLRAAGHEVIAYSDGDRLEDKLAIECPDVLLLDIVMPRRSGYEILRRIRKDERIRHIPVVLVTGRDQDSDRLWGKRQGADEYVTKPFTPAELLTVVTRFTGDAGLTPV